MFTSSIYWQSEFQVKAVSSRSVILLILYPTLPDMLPT